MAKRSFLDRLGLHRPELRAWALYDVANSAWMTTIIMIFPLFFYRVAASDLAPEVARSRYAFAIAISTILVGLVGPVLGAIADYRGTKKAFLGAFLAFGVAGTAAMYFIGEGQWVFGLAMFIISNIGIMSTLAFYNALLPGIAGPDEVDRVSTAGFALGYLGGGVLFLVNSLMIANPETFGIADAGTATRIAFASVAVWWVLFSIPLFRKVPETPPRLEADEEAGENAVVVGLAPSSGDVPRAAQVQGRRAAAARLPRLQRRDQHHHPAGHLVRQRGRHSGDPHDRGPGDRAVRRRAFRLCLRSPRGPDRGQECHLHRPGGLQLHLGLRLLAPDVGPVLRDRGPGGHGAGRGAGPGTVALRHRDTPATRPARCSASSGSSTASEEPWARWSSESCWPPLGSSRPAILTLIVFFALGAYLLSKVDVERGRRVAREAEAALHPAE